MLEYVVMKSGIIASMFAICWFSCGAVDRAESGDSVHYPLEGPFETFDLSESQKAELDALYVGMVRFVEKGGERR